MTKIKSALTIAGTDPTGGAGIQADLKTFQEREVYGMSVVTSAVAQNTMGVTDVHHLPVAFLEQQLEAVFKDIVPDAVKTGMIATPEMIETVVEMLKKYNVPLVIDPVMVATSGDMLVNEEARQLIREKLMPMAEIVTPNLHEAQVLAGFKVETRKDIEKAAKMMVHELGAKAAVIKGGHGEGEATDYLYDGRDFHIYSSPRTDTIHTHGTGCTFSAVITAELAKGRTITEAVQTGKDFITDAIHFSLGIGKGNGPTNHWGNRLKGFPHQQGEFTDGRFNKSNR